MTRRPATESAGRGRSPVDAHRLVAGQPGVEAALERRAHEGQSDEQEGDGGHRRQQPPPPRVGEEQAPEVEGVAHDRAPTGPGRVHQPEEGQPGLDGDGPLDGGDQARDQDQPDLGQDVGPQHLARARPEAHRGPDVGPPAQGEHGRPQAVDGLTPGQQARVLCARALLALFPPDLARAEELAIQGLRRGEALDDEVIRATATYALATVAFNRGHYVEASQRAERVLVRVDDHPELGVGLGWRHLNQLGRLLLCQSQVRLDEVEEAGDTLRRALRAIREHGYRGLQASGQALTVVQRYEIGEWDDAATEFETLTDLSADVGQFWGLDLAAGARSLISFHRGDPQAAADFLGIATRSASRGPIDRQLATLAEALLAESTGSQGRALAVLVERWDDLVGKGVLAACLAMGPDLVRLARLAGDLERAFDACRVVESIAAANPGVASILGTSLRCRGLAEDDVEILTGAAAACRDSPFPLGRAQAIEDAAGALARAGDLTAARPLFADALQAYELLDATWDIGRVRSRTRALGLRQGSRGGASGRARDGRRSPGASGRWSSWWRRGCRTGRWPSGCSCPRTR